MSIDNNNNNKLIITTPILILMIITTFISIVRRIIIAVIVTVTVIASNECVTKPPLRMRYKRSILISSRMERGDNSHISQHPAVC